MTRPVYLRGVTVLILQALRAGPLEWSQIEMRFGYRGGEINRLVRAGYAERVPDGYRITEAGRAACPNRRDV